MGTVVVTGANRGIGLELCRLLLSRGEAVIAVCRGASEALRGTAARIEEGVDLTQEEGVAALAGRLAGTRVDLLIHNAGILNREGLEDLNLESVRRQFEINALGPLRLTHALLQNLGPGSRVAIITSRMGSLSDNSSGGYYGYRMSKAAVNMAGISLAHDLRPRQIAVGLFHPGYVRTEMTGFQGNADPDEAARMLLDRIDALSVQNTGRFWHANGELLPW
jgi:NAD(P)-dependent dehydrogenase (short-subunit alcohol dehydrogenase family)